MTGDVRRGIRDCYKCMWLASQEDPERAIWKECAETAERVNAIRNEHVSQNPSAAVQDSSVQQRSKSVQTAIGLNRKMRPARRLEVGELLADDVVGNAGDVAQFVQDRVPADAVFLWPASSPDFGKTELSE
jgi:hypothetical protein